MTRPTETKQTNPPTLTPAELAAKLQRALLDAKGAAIDLHRLFSAARVHVAMAER